MDNNLKYRAIKADNFPYGGYIDLYEKIIMFLEDNPNSSMTKIRKAVKVSSVTFRNAIMKLEKEGKVEYEWNHDDRVFKSYALILEDDD